MDRISSETRTGCRLSIDLLVEGLETGVEVEVVVEVEVEFRYKEEGGHHISAQSFMRISMDGEAAMMKSFPHPTRQQKFLRCAGHAMEKLLCSAKPFMKLFSLSSVKKI